MKYLNSLERGVEKVITALAGIGMGAITLIIFIQVIYRYILGSSISWAEEVALYIEVWVVFLCAGYALGKGQHICMDILSSRLPRRVQFVVDKFISLVCLFFALFCTKYGWAYVMSERTQSMAALQLPKWIAYAAMLVGSVIMVFYCALLLLKPPDEPSADQGEEGLTC